MVRTRSMTMRAPLVLKAGASSPSPVDIVLLVCSGYGVFAGPCIAHWPSSTETECLVPLVMRSKGFPWSSAGSRLIRAC